MPIPIGWIKQPDGSYSKPARKRYAIQKPEGSRMEPKEKVSHGVSAPRNQAAHGGHHRQFRVTIACDYSGRRDGDGVLATVLDCLISARRRLIRSYTGGIDVGQAGEAGAGTHDDNH